MKTFLDKNEQGKFNSSFFPREIQREDTNEIITVELGNLYVQEEQSYQNAIGKRDVNLVKDFFDKNTSFWGVWINGKKGDGISWLAANTQLYSEKKKSAYSAEIRILKEDKEVNSPKIPIINDVFDNKNTFFNCVKKSKLIKKSYLKSSAIFVAISTGLAELANIILQYSFSSHTSVIFISLFALSLILVLYSLIKEKSDKNIEKCLEIIEDIMKKT